MDQGNWQSCWIAFHVSCCHIVFHVMRISGITVETARQSCYLSVRRQVKASTPRDKSRLEQEIKSFFWDRFFLSIAIFLMWHFMMCRKKKKKKLGNLASVWVGRETEKIEGCVHKQRNSLYLRADSSDRVLTLSLFRWFSAPWWRRWPPASQLVDQLLPVAGKLRLSARSVWFEMPI